MKKPIAVMVNSKEEYDLAIKALDLVGFRWHNCAHISRWPYRDGDDKYICVNPADNTDDRGFCCVFTENADWDLKDWGVDCEILSLDDFIKLFSSMTEQDSIDFCKSYFEEEDAPEEDEEEVCKGVKHDSDKIRITTLFERPFAEQIEQVVKVLEMGAKKYSDHNWIDVAKGKNGEQRYADAFRRHWQALLKGEVNDKESGFSHYAHAIANLFFLFWNEDNK